MKALTKEAIDILYDNGLLPYDYISALSFRLQKYFTRELKTLRKKFEQRYLGSKLALPVKRPKRPSKLNVSWLHMHKAYQQGRTEPHHKIIVSILCGKMMGVCLLTGE